MEHEIGHSIRNALQALSTPKVDFSVEHPSDISHGDYATNAALIAAKQGGKNPHETAQELAAHLNEHLPNGVAGVEVAGPGFINFRLSPAFFTERISAILEEDRQWGKGTSLSGKKVLLEYTDQNPFKEFHIGHLMSNAIGESIARLVEYAGAEVRRANYQGDVGIHVAKAIWGMMHLVEGERDASAWGRAYPLGATAFEDDPKAKEEITALNKAIYERSDENVNKLYDEGRAVSLEHFEEIYRKLGTKFDFYFFESDVAPIGAEIVRSNLGTVFEQSDGAIVFKGENYDPALHTRVFLNSHGLPTYEAKELGLAKKKEESWAFDLSLSITGNEIREYFKVLQKAIGLVLPELAGKILHIPHGMLRIPGGKMSSRKGSVITGESLLTELENAVLEKMAGRDLASGEREDIAQAVAVSAIKFAILKQSAGKDIIFEKEQALSFEGDSGPYLQYAHVRACSVLTKAHEAQVAPDTKGAKPEPGPLEKLLYRFPEVTKRAVAEYDPHYVTTYLTELAGAFNSYYANGKIVDMSEEMPYKVALVKAFEITMRNGLHLLGIRAPERM